MSKMTCKAIVAGICAVLGACLAFPGLRHGKMHWDAIRWASIFLGCYHIYVVCYGTMMTSPSGMAVIKHRYSSFGIMFLIYNYYFQISQLKPFSAVFTSLLLLCPCCCCPVVGSASSQTLSCQHHLARIQQTHVRSLQFCVFLLSSSRASMMDCLPRIVSL